MPTNPSFPFDLPMYSEVEGSGLNSDMPSELSAINVHSFDSDLKSLAELSVIDVHGSDSESEFRKHIPSLGPRHVIQVHGSDSESDAGAESQSRQ